MSSRRVISVVLAAAVAVQVGTSGRARAQEAGDAPTLGGQALERAELAAQQIEAATAEVASGLEPTMAQALSDIAANANATAGGDLAAGAVHAGQAVVDAGVETTYAAAAAASAESEGAIILLHSAKGFIALSGGFMTEAAAMTASSPWFLGGLVAGGAGLLGYDLGKRLAGGADLQNHPTDVPFRFLADPQYGEYGAIEVKMSGHVSPEQFAADHTASDPNFSQAGLQNVNWGFAEPGCSSIGYDGIVCSWNYDDAHQTALFQHVGVAYAGPASQIPWIDDAKTHVTGTGPSDDGTMTVIALGPTAYSIVEGDGLNTFCNGGCYPNSNWDVWGGKVMVDIPAPQKLGAAPKNWGQDVVDNPRGNPKLVNPPTMPAMHEVDPATIGNKRTFIEPKDAGQPWQVGTGVPPSSQDDGQPGSNPTPTPDPSTAPTSSPGASSAPSASPSTSPSASPTATPTPKPSAPGVVTPYSSGPDPIKDFVDGIKHKFPADLVGDTVDVGEDSDLAWVSFDGVSYNGQAVGHRWDLNFLKPILKAGLAVGLAGLAVLALLWI